MEVQKSNGSIKRGLSWLEESGQVKSYLKQGNKAKSGGGESPSVHTRTLFNLPFPLL
jgi:hypothetical protein